MRLSSLSRRALVTTVAGGALAVAAVVVPMHADAAGPLRATCTASVDYEAGAFTSTYASTFDVRTGAPFVDDRSTPLRGETFTATVTGNDVQIDYFKDVNTFDSVQVDTTVSLGTKTGAQSGRHVFATSNTPNRVTTYTVTCRR